MDAAVAGTFSKKARTARVVVAVVWVMAEGTEMS
jgi:hypothetical protein